MVDLLFYTLANAWFSILINDESIGFFKSSREVWQGNPLPPTLFLFVTKFLGKAMHHLFLQDKRSFFVLRGTKVPYLAITDNTIIFTRSSEESLKALRDS